MEEEGIGLVLAKATDLRMKINNCIHKGNDDDSSPIKENGVHVDGDVGDQLEEEEGEEESERLFTICDALESLENQLSTLQTLQQQQRYEREVSLAEIENSRKMLLEKIREYKGKDLEVIHEASAFAGETVDHSNDLLLPPYPSRSPNTLVNGYFPRAHKPLQNGVITNDVTNGAKEDSRDAERSKRSLGLGSFLVSAAKTVLTVVGVVSVLSVSGYGPKIMRSNTAFNILGRFKQPPSEEKRSTVECPPGRVLVVEDGKARCVVKERVEVPFSSVVARPDINYGCG